MQDKGLGFLLDETPLLWRWTEDGIVTLVGVLGIWPVIVLEHLVNRLQGSLRAFNNTIHLR